MRGMRGMFASILVKMHNEHIFDSVATRVIFSSRVRVGKTSPASPASPARMGLAVAFKVEEDSAHDRYP
jgi:hypothetical protein